MGRLIKEALYSSGDNDYFEEDLTGLDPEARQREVDLAFERAPERIRRIDPDGRISSALLKEVESGEKGLVEKAIIAELERVRTYTMVIDGPRIDIDDIIARLDSDKGVHDAYNALYKIRKHMEDGDKQAQEARKRLYPDS